MSDHLTHPKSDIETKYIKKKKKQYFGKNVSDKIPSDDKSTV